MNDKIFPHYRTTKIKDAQPGELFFFFNDRMFPCIKIKVGIEDLTYVLVLDTAVISTDYDQTETVLVLNNPWRFQFTPLLPSTRENNPYSIPKGNIAASKEGLIFLATIKRHGFPGHQEGVISLDNFSILDIGKVQGDSSYYGPWIIEVLDEQVGIWKQLYINQE
jgi:hypothetical protein